MGKTDEKVAEMLPNGMPVRKDRKHKRKSMWRVSNQSEGGNRVKKARTKPEKRSDGEKSKFWNINVDYMDRLLQE